jgi:TPR repeat protein
LQALKANIPMGISSRSELVVSVVSADGVVLAEARTVLIIGQTAAGRLPAQTAAAPPPQNLVPPQAASRSERALSRGPSTEERALAERLVAQGERYFTVGDVVSARLLFRRAAAWDFAPAALRLAATYDPSELRRLQVEGVAADRNEARKWYERARELGAPEAEERLARLGR